MNGPYDDIIHLPHHVSTTHLQMPIAERAAQFAPFKAMVGYDAQVEEAARLTDARVVLGEEAVAELDRKLAILTNEIDQHPQITVTYFRPDDKKQGGAYISLTESIKKVDEFERTLAFMNGAQIPIDNILEIEGELFQAFI